MKAIVLGFSGKTSSGKTTLSAAVAEELGWPRVSFGDHVRRIAAGKTINVSRRNLQEIGASLIEADPVQFCEAVLAQSVWKPGQSLIIDGIRHQEIIGILRELVQPSTFRMVFIDIDNNTRKGRLKDEGISKMEMLKIDSHSTEHQVNTGLKESADFIVDGRKTIEMLLRDVINWMQNAI